MDLLFLSQLPVCTLLRDLQIVPLPFVTRSRWCMCGPCLFQYTSPDNWNLEMAQGRCIWAMEQGVLAWWLGSSPRPRLYFDWPPV